MPVDRASRVKGNASGVKSLRWLLPLLGTGVSRLCAGRPDGRARSERSGLRGGEWWFSFGCLSSWRYFSRS